VDLQLNAPVASLNAEEYTLTPAYFEELEWPRTFLYCILEEVMSTCWSCGKGDNSNQHERSELYMERRNHPLQRAIVNDVTRHSSTRESAMITNLSPPKLTLCAHTYTHHEHIHTHTPWTHTHTHTMNTYTHTPWTHTHTHTMNAYTHSMNTYTPHTVILHWLVEYCY